MLTSAMLEIENVSTEEKTIKKLNLVYFDYRIYKF